MEIKKIKLILAFVIASLISGAQNFEIPQKEFKLSFSKDQMELFRGGGGQIEISVLKAKGYGKGEIKMGVSSSLPQGVTVAFDPDKGNFDFTKVIVSVGANTMPGTYSLILNATLNYKTKGSILKLIIKE